jgi:hypothetical protein
MSICRRSNAIRSGTAHPGAGISHARGRDRGRVPDAGKAAERMRHEGYHAQRLEVHVRNRFCLRTVFAHVLILSVRRLLNDESVSDAFVVKRYRLSNAYYV